MKIIIKQLFLNVIFASFLFYSGHAQEKLGGNYDVKLKKAYCAGFKDSINWLYVKEPDSIPNTPRGGYAETISFGIPINKNFFELATMLETAGNEYTFLLRITQEKAFNTMLFFNEYYLPDGPEITFLDTNGVLLDTNMYIVYDSYRNKRESEEGRITFPIPPDAIIKLTCRKSKFSECILDLKYVQYVYRELTMGSIQPSKSGFIQKLNPLVKSSQSCDFSIPCFNEHTNWFNEINSVVRIESFVSLGGGSGMWVRGSGTFLNTPDSYNFDYSKKPFLLTVAHLLDTMRAHGVNVNSVLELDTRLYMLYQKTSCGGSIGSYPIEGKGLTIVFEGQRSHNLDWTNDYMLLQLRKTEIGGLKNLGNITFAGWDANTKSNYQLQESIPAFCFHHPDVDGPDKKYMEYNTIYNHANNYYTYYQEKGFTQKGSSGSPVFDKNHRLIGLIAGGDNNATCSNPNDPVGPKFSYIFPNIKQYLGTTEKTAYFYDPNYAHTPGHCTNCVADHDQGEIYVDCGGPCKPCGHVLAEQVIIDDSRELADLIQSKTVTISGSNTTLKTAETSSIYFENNATINAGISVEKGASFQLSNKPYSNQYYIPCEKLCGYQIPNSICKGYEWFIYAPNATRIEYEIYQEKNNILHKIYENTTYNWSNDKIILWDFIEGVETGSGWVVDIYFRKLKIYDCEGLKYSDSQPKYLYHTVLGCD